MANRSSLELHHLAPGQGHQRHLHEATKASHSFSDEFIHTVQGSGRVGATLGQGAIDYGKDMVQHHLLQVGETLAVGAVITAVVLTAPAWLGVGVAVAGAALVADEVYEAGKKVMPDLKIIMDGHDNAKVAKAEQRVKANSGQAVFDGLLLVGSVGAGAAVRPLIGTKIAAALTDGVEDTTISVEGVGAPRRELELPEIGRVQKTIAAMPDPYLRAALEKNFLPIKDAFKNKNRSRPDMSESALIRNWNATLNKLEDADDHEKVLLDKLKIAMPLDPPVSAATLKLGQADIANLSSHVRKSELTKTDGTRESGYFHIFEVQPPSGEVRIANEIAANRLSRLVGLENGYPKSTPMTVDNSGEILNGWHQPDAGPTLETVLRNRIHQEHGHISEPHLQVVALLSHDPELREELMDAMVFRLICGDEDIHARNITVSKSGSNPHFHNIDMDFAFGEQPEPLLKTYGGGLVSVGIHRALESRAIPIATMEHLKTFLAQYDNPLGRTFLQNELPLSEKQIDAILLRTEFLVRSGKIPAADDDFVGHTNVRLLEREERNP